MRRSERPLTQVPRPILLGFAIGLFLQILNHQNLDNKSDFNFKPLAEPHRAKIYEGMSMGSYQLFSYLLTMRLQLHDNQVGRHIPYNKINYSVLVEWLEMLNALNADSEYPMMLASRVYSQTRDKEQLRILLTHIDRIFKSNPQIHWRRQAEATVIAKHQLGDKKLALHMATSLKELPGFIEMPHWARDMQFLLLADLNEYESAIAIIQALLQSGSISDPDELRFLQEKLLSFQQKLSKSQQIESQ